VREREGEATLEDDGPGDGEDNREKARVALQAALGDDDPDDGQVAAATGGGSPSKLPAYSSSKRRVAAPASPGLAKGGSSPALAAKEAQAAKEAKAMRAASALGLPSALPAAFTPEPYDGAQHRWPDVPAGKAPHTGGMPLPTETRRHLHWFGYHEPRWGKKEWTTVPQMKMSRICS
jgi:hypothetical protein